MFIVTLLLASQVFGLGLRNSEDIFSQPTRGSLQEVLSQLTLSTGEAALAYWVWPDVTELKAAQYEAEKQLDLIRRTPTSIEEKNALIEGYLASQIEKSREVVALRAPAKPNVPTLTDKLEFLYKTDVVTASERAARVEAAEAALGAAKMAALEEAQKMGFFKWIRGARKLGSAVVMSDVAGRVYVWGSLGANPGLSPLGGYSATQIAALLGL